MTPVRILRDSGASQSFILEHVLPFSAVTDTGNRTPVLGVSLVPLSVPLHQLMLSSDLLNGEVVLGVCKSLPMEGVDVVLGNNLNGARVWKDGPPALVVTTSREYSGSLDVCATRHPHVFPVCAVTRAMSRARSEKSGDSTPDLGVSEGVQDQALVCPWPLPSDSRGELIAEQAVDPTLTSLFGLVCSKEKIQGLVNGYFIQEGVLYRKWARFVDNGKLSQVTQVVVPSGFRKLVLSTSHDVVAGHLGVKKT